MIDLPKFYLITMDLEKNESDYLSAIESSLKNGVKLIQLRSKQLPIDEYTELAIAVSLLVRKYGGKLILNGPPNLLGKVDADGIHLPSSKYLMENERPIPRNFLLSVACHNEEQFLHAKKIETDIAVICPIFATPSSPQGIPLGWKRFANMARTATFPVYALGGLTPNDLESALSHGAHGIAAKRALWNIQQPIDL